jgi:hypothetical protein
MTRKIGSNVSLWICQHVEKAIMNQNKIYSRIESVAMSFLVIACVCSQLLGISPAYADQLQRQADTSPAPTMIGGCPIFPANNIWNTPISNLPIHSRSDQWVNTIGRSTGFHMDFGSGTWDGGPIGIPYNVVGNSVPKTPVSFYFLEESDPGPYPIPANPLIEHGSDHHILIVDNSTCTLYELFDASYSGGSWHAGSGAIWNLNSNALRPDTWTSADAAGLPILPGLVRYDEILSGEINHAIRFTAANTNGYIWPARHLTSNNPSNPQIPPMGARFRLKASVNISGYPPEMQVILTAMKTYGIILADNGSNWYVSGAPDSRWDNDMLHLLDDLTGNDFEAVNVSGLMIDYDSGATGFSISGNTGVAGVILSYIDSTPKTATSQVDGNYSLPVSNNWSGTVTPSHSCYTFAPTSRTYDNVTTNQTSQNYTATINPASGCADIDVLIGGGDPKWSYGLPAHFAIVNSYPNMNNGPVRVSSTNGVNIISSQRVVWGAGFDELMGYPANQLTDEYVFPWYNNKAMSSQLRIGNTGTVAADVDVYIGGTKMNTTPYNIAVGGSQRLEYAGINNGPVRIVTTTSAATILTTMRVIWGAGYDELMGYPANQLTNEYVFPWYNNKAMSSQLRIGNTGTVAVDVDVYIGGTKMNTTPYNIAVGGSERIEYAGINSGPVRVVTTTSGASILATMRVIWGAGYDELMGYPANRLTTDYVFPKYSDTSLDTQLRIGNTGTVPVEVDVYAGSTKLNDAVIAIPVGGSARLDYSGVEAGPLRVVTTTPGASILATERLIKGNGYDELMGYPANQLTTEYLFPWYNNKAMSSEILIAVP